MHVTGESGGMQIPAKMQFQNFGLREIVLSEFWSPTDLHDSGARLHPSHVTRGLAAVGRPSQVDGLSIIDTPRVVADHPGARGGSGTFREGSQIDFQKSAFIFPTSAISTAQFGRAAHVLSS